jgi:redox-sensitive bicupin YhaK (pirin superfamily)
MVTIRKAEEHGHANHGWLDSNFTFSFADYHDPRHMGFRSLRVINDDIIAGGGGFGTHPMAAGTGVQHSEFNHSPTGPVHFLQIWILPDRKNAKPNYAEKYFTNAATGKFHLVASKNGRDGSIAINQDADVFLGKMAAGGKISHALKPDRHAWIHVAEGEVKLGDLLLKAGDAATLSGESLIDLTGKSAAQVLLFDLN